MMIPALVATAVAGLLAAAPSPSPTPSAPPLIGSVTVATGSKETLHRLPLPASLLSAAQIDSLPALTGDEVLRALPGFDRTRSNSAFTNYGQLRVSFAGAGNDRGLVFADGIFAQDGFGGQVDWAAYPAFDLTRAELLRGPGSALYGAGAIGGVLSLQTHAPTARTSGPADGAFTFAGGTHGALDASVSVTAPLSSRVAFSLAASDQQLSYLTLPPAYQTALDRPAYSRAKMTSMRLRYRIASATTIDYGYRGAWDYQQEGRPNYDFWRTFVQHSLGVQHAWKQASLSINGYARTTFVTNRADKSSAPGSLLYTQYVPTHESGGIADWIVDSPSSTFEMRGDARFVAGESNQQNAAGIKTASGSGTQETVDLAAQNTWRFTRGQVVAGLAATSVYVSRGVPARTDRALSPRVAARYDLSKQLAVRASAGTGLRAPFLNELVRGYAIGSVSYLPNANLVPERSSSESAGLDWTDGRSEVSADFIQTYVSDAISFRTLDPTHQMRSNFARAQVDGLTVTYARRTGSCSNLHVWATQQNARVTEATPATAGKQLPYVPSDSAFAGYDTQAGAMHVGVNLTYTGRTYADDLNLQPLGTAATAGFSVSAPLRDGVRLLFSGDNVTGARYLSSIDRYAPPTVFSLGLSLPIDERAASSCP